MSKAAELAALIGSQTALSNRNLIINGAMQVAQRGTQTTGVTAAGYHTVDRIKLNVTTLGTWTVDQSTDSPDGFSNSYKVTCTTADASPASSDFCLIQTSLEGQNLQSLGYGTSAAKSMTLSFYVKSNKTGAANAYLYSPDTGKIYSYTYSITSANTWQFVSQTIPADTASAIGNDNGEGLRVVWALNSGSDFRGGSVGGWKTFSATHINVNNLGVGGATNDYFQVSGIQLELGEQETPFEHRSFGDELARCQRYYQRIESNGTYDSLLDGMHYVNTQFYAMHTFPVQMRAEPTMSGSGTFAIFSNGADRTPDSLVLNRATKEVVQTYCALSSGAGTAGHGGHIRNNNDADTFLEFIAEL